MKEIKKGTMVKCWDEGGENSCRVCFYDKYNAECHHPHRVTLNKGGRVGSYYQHVEPLRLMPELPQGVKIGDEVEVSLFRQGWKKVTLSTMTIDGQFVCNEGEFWGLLPAN